MKMADGWISFSFDELEFQIATNKYIADGTVEIAYKCSKDESNRWEIDEQEIETFLTINIYDETGNIVPEDNIILDALNDAIFDQLESQINQQIFEDGETGYW